MFRSSRSFLYQGKSAFPLHGDLDDQPFSSPEDFQSDYLKDFYRCDGHPHHLLTADQDAFPLLHDEPFASYRCLG